MNESAHYGSENEQCKGDSDEEADSHAEHHGKRSLSITHQFHGFKILLDVHILTVIVDDGCAAVGIIRIGKHEPNAFEINVDRVPIDHCVRCNFSNSLAFFAARRFARFCCHAMLGCEGKVR